MSPRNFARLFAQEFGTTPGRYLLQLRVEAARRLLEQTDKSDAGSECVRLPECRRHATDVAANSGHKPASVSAPLSDAGREISYPVGDTPWSARRCAARNREGGPRRDGLKPPVELHVADTRQSNAPVIFRQRV
jgi:helix-turn-helix protein